MSLAPGDMVVLLRSDPGCEGYVHGLRVGAIGTVVSLDSCFNCRSHNQLSCMVTFPSMDGCCPQEILRKIDGELRETVDWDWRTLTTKQPETAND